MEKLKTADALIVSQKKEWGEILTGFETRNKYSVSDPSGQQVYWAAEESSVMARLFLKGLRPFKFHILSVDGKPAVEMEKPFRFYFHEISVLAPGGKKLGSVKREFSLFQRKFIVLDPQGADLYTICAPFLHPWTFKISMGSIPAGEILKKWSGLGKEAFTDSDNFSVRFPQGASEEQKAVLLGALFLIDMVHFEK